MHFIEQQMPGVDERSYCDSDELTSITNTIEKNACSIATVCTSLSCHLNSLKAREKSFLSLYFKVNESSVVQ